MASVDFMKLKSPKDVRAVLWHNDKEKRMMIEHSNEDIDKSRTHQNIQWFDEPGSADKLYHGYLAKLAELDAEDGANTRKDRVTCFSLYVPIVPGIKDEDRKKYSKIVTDAISQMYPDSMILNSFWHFDEEHEYVDAVTGETRTSLDHGHIMVMPIVKDANGVERLNAKAFSSRNNMVKLNRKIHEAIKAEFGVDFMTGAGKNKNDVKSLKMASKRKELEIREDRASEREKALKTNEKALNDRIKALDSREKALEVREQNVEKAEKHYNELIDDVMALRPTLKPEDQKRVDDMVDHHKQLLEQYKKEIVDAEYITDKDQYRMDKYFGSGSPDVY